MKVQQLQQNEIRNIRQQNFKGAGDAFLRYLATNQAVGANAVDVAFMVIPRTGTDLIGRGPAAGLETARREASGTVNHTLIGTYGTLAGAGIAGLMGLKGKYNTNVNKIMAAPETLNILAEYKANQIKADSSHVSYLKDVLSNIEAFNPKLSTTADGYIKLSSPEHKNFINEIATMLDEVILDKDMNFNKWNKKGTNKSFNAVVNKIIEKTGAESKYLLKSADGKTVSETSLKTLLEDIYKVSEEI